MSSETSQVVEQANAQTRARRASVVVRILQGFLVVAFPVLLVLVSVRLVMTPAFLHFEYTRPGFPDDFYGFTREDRLRYAPYAIDYLIDAKDISYLGALQFPDGSPLFNARELRHMRDVQMVTQVAYALAAALGLLALFAIIVLWRQSRAHLRLALLQGSMLTLGLVATIIIVAVFNWEFFFVGFHTLFFESNSWYFEYSDTLIRLFPEQFWFDAALLVGGVTTVTALAVLFVTWRWGQSQLRALTRAEADDNLA